MQLRNTIVRYFGLFFMYRFFFNDKQIKLGFEDADICKVLKCRALWVNVVCHCIKQVFAGE